jgi:hypothetical protein
MVTKLLGKYIKNDKAESNRLIVFFMLLSFYCFTIFRVTRSPLGDTSVTT